MWFVTGPVLKAKTKTKVIGKKLVVWKGKQLIGSYKFNNEIVLQVQNKEGGWPIFTSAKVSAIDVCQFYLLLFLPCWDLNSGPQACYSCALPLSYFPGPIQNIF